MWWNPPGGEDGRLWAEERSLRRWKWNEGSVVVRSKHVRRGHFVLEAAGGRQSGTKQTGAVQGASAKGEMGRATRRRRERVEWECEGRGKSGSKL